MTIVLVLHDLNQAARYLGRMIALAGGQILADVGARRPRPYASGELPDSFLNFHQAAAMHLDLGEWQFAPTSL